MISLERDGDLAILTLSHGRANALDLELCQRLITRLDQAEEAAATVLTGSGHIFSAGVDLRRLIDGGRTYIREFLPLSIRAFERLFSFRKPLVAALNGHAVAGGCVVACTADYRIMAHGQGRIGIPELRVGVPFPHIAIEIMRLATPGAHLQELIYVGSTSDPSQAVERGLIDEVVPPGRELERGCEIARKLAALPAATFELAKRQIRAPAWRNLAAVSDQERQEVLDLWCSDATLELVRRYVARVLDS